MSDFCSGGPGGGTGGEPSEQCFFRGPADRDLPLDEVFSLLGDRRRRLVLRYFREEGTTVAAVEDLVAFVTRWERELGVAPDRDAVAISLRHGHLPKLAAADVVAFEDRGSTVRYRGSDRLERFLAVAMDEGVRP